MCWGVGVGGVIWGDGGGSLSACWLSSLEHLPLRLEQMRRRGGEREGHAGSPGFLPGCRGEISQKPTQPLRVSNISQVLCFAVYRSDFLH